MMMAFRQEFLKALIHDPEWSRRLDRARTAEQVQKVCMRFARVKGYKVVELRK